MALDGTFTGLVASVGAFLQRQDTAAAIPDFITLAEAEINRRLTCQDTEFVQTLSVAAESVPLPAGLRAVMSLRSNSPLDDGRLTYMSPQAMDDLLVGAVGTPRHYTIAGGKLVFWPIPDAAYFLRLRGRRELDGLGVLNPTNWLLCKHPDTYLHGALVQANLYLKNDDGIARFTAKFDAGLAAIELQDKAIVSDSVQTRSGISDGHRHHHRSNGGAYP